MNCPSCGRGLRSGDRFCLNCGERVRPARAAKPSTEAPASEPGAQARPDESVGVEHAESGESADPEVAGPPPLAESPRSLPPLPVAPDVPSVAPTKKSERPAAGPHRRNFFVAAILAVILLLSAVAVVASGGDDTSPPPEPGSAAPTGSEDEFTAQDSTPAADTSTSTTRATTIAPSASATDQPNPSTTTAPTTTLPPIEQLDVSTATASATAARSSVRLRCTGELTLYTPEMLIDGDLNTGWGAGQDDGEGESITINFGRTVELTHIGLTPGFAKVGPRRDNNCRDTSAFPHNAFVASVLYTFDDGSSVLHEFEQRPDVQSIDLLEETGASVATRTVRITILETQFPVGADSDTILSEAVFWGYA